ncbi:MAG TPA: hypothetical protein VK625_07515, partial [Flavitalea sp.]|nr:hypothetical protein [Flavitalea sp.]
MNNRIVGIYSVLFVVFVLHCPFTFAQNNRRADKSIMAFVNATIYPSPSDSAIHNGTVLTRNDKIISVGIKSEVKIPKNASIIDCKGLIITAGFWNSHVHFIDARVANAKGLSDKELSNYLQMFLTKYGFTYAFDIGSFLENTQHIKRRIESDSVFGPLILTTGMPLAPENGTPFYLKAINITLPELTSPGMAISTVGQYLTSGSDGIKIFAGSPVEQGKEEKIMPLEIAKAVTSATHERNKPVFAHPSVNEGIQVAIASGVDILAHTTPDGGRPWDSLMVQQMVANNMYLIPTLKLWKWVLQNDKLSPQKIEVFVAVAIEQVKKFQAAGGKVLFGTDIGFVDDFDPTDEYVYLQKAGFNFRQIL